MINRYKTSNNAIIASRNHLFSIKNFEIVYDKNFNGSFKTILLYFSNSKINFSAFICFIAFNFLLCSINFIE